MMILKVSVPIWGLFNLTSSLTPQQSGERGSVSVPIWGLFNLTAYDTYFYSLRYEDKFPSPSGDYLI